ncbi:hypothetical protein DUI87_18564 [Hirundo rustica rustica]|uniref:Uncharacterized protein n=1 Tax=Hirundo rustica rustica TaxID=333673 RepID=A0A3M0JX67_HIRRU|nr:hypothetical protein DUI87_18564 [Hirundo rustica rustica]
MSGDHSLSYAKETGYTLAVASAHIPPWIFNHSFNMAVYTTDPQPQGWLTEVRPKSKSSEDRDEADQDEVQELDCRSCSYTDSQLDGLKSE